MTLFYYDPLFLEHRTGQHPERPERLVQVVRHLERTGIERRLTRPDWDDASLARLALVHEPGYLQFLEEYVTRGGGRIEEDTVCGPRSFEVARRAAGAVCDAVERVVRGEDATAFCLVRPPGHHALVAAPMGFCLLGNVAVGARLAIKELGLERVLIVDWDVHHGNGTQAMCWDDEQIGFLSIHRWPFYPGTGSEAETGAGAGLGTKLNLPIEMGTSRVNFLERFTRGLEQLARRMKPQLILLSAGFDAHRDDPVGSLGLETEDFAPLTTRVLDIAQEYCGGKLVSVLEGGYNPGVLAGCVALHLQELLASAERG